MVWMKRSGLEELAAVPILLLLVVIFMPLGAYFAREALINALADGRSGCAGL
jgi:hypothetical protein